MKYLEQVPIIGIIRGAGTKAVEGAVAAAVEGGLRALEITLNRPEACDQIAQIKKRYGDKIALGAGTVLDPAAAARALDAGAEFIVTPALLPDVIAFCKERNVPVFPGAMTPTEVLAAHKAGADMVKVFPASVLGAAYIKSLKGPFPFIRLMPTGGVTVEAVQGYFQAGAAALGVGSELFKKEWMEKGDWAEIEKTAAAYVSAVKKINHG
ncbi:MAG TPA: bifunctional 4-hydroxy-2-oxoglutarate aldolase/2-dehydro-3-deoxy-phosphogluconate aldolase [bacterium]|nr:bifunctional 4-hydroxy-2-oxoglutarate aldolase/2-dehydro-3-deoxy-phosphogluconate aldolase [bacterium]